MNTIDVVVLVLTLLLCPSTALKSEEEFLYYPTFIKNSQQRGRELDTSCNYDCAFESDYGKVFCVLFFEIEKKNGMCRDMIHNTYEY